jgi:hypothetical protein
MPGTRRRVVLSSINSELRLKNTGITINVVDPDPNLSGRLRIGRATLQWFPKYKKNAKGEKNWEDFIAFILSK